MKPRITETDIKIIDEWLAEMAKDPVAAFTSRTTDETSILAMIAKQFIQEQKDEINNWIEAYEQY